jgi:XTP/dITP diphosphohydrolase
MFFGMITTVMRILVASHNGHKIKEIKEYFKHLDIEIISLRDIDFDFEIEETGKTFLDNALIKAKTIQSFYPNHAILADDSGFSVKALGNEPGVNSARFLGSGTVDALKNKEILKLLEGVIDRKAMFTCAMVLLTPSQQFVTQQVVYGSVSQEIRGTGSFGYDPIFIPEHTTKTFAEDLEYKAKVSHRSKALMEVLKYVEYLAE